MHLGARSSPAMKHWTLADERDIAEVTIVVAAIGVFLWFGRQVFTGFDVLFGISLLAMLAYSHQRADEHWRDIGFRIDTFWPTLRLLLPVVIIGGAAIWGTSVVLRKLGSPPPDVMPTRVPAFVVFGIAQ